MDVIQNRDGKWILEDRPRLLKIYPVNSQIARSLVIVPLKNL